MPAPPPIGLNLSSSIGYPVMKGPGSVTLHFIAAVPANVVRVDYFVETAMGRLPVGYSVLFPFAVDWTTSWAGPATVLAEGRDASGNVVASGPGATLQIT